MRRRKVLLLETLSSFAVQKKIMKFAICFLLLSISVTIVYCSDPWGWQTPSSTYNFDDSHGEGRGYGHDNKNIYDKAHVDNFNHENVHESGAASGYAKGEKTDWANYQYGGEGSRAEGDTFEKHYGTSYGEGHDHGHTSGGHDNHDEANGRNSNEKNGWGYLPHYTSEINENGHDPW